jgi:hypothetical protein
LTGEPSATWEQINGNFFEFQVEIFSSHEAAGGSFLVCLTGRSDSRKSMI